MKKGTYVSRAAFAKMQGERDRLLKDIYTFAMGDIPDVIFLRSKWREKFRKDKWLIDALKEAAKTYKDITPKQPDLGDPKIDSAKGAFK
jgi:hypothetical protein